MPRPRTPLEKARLTGADRNHPERFRDRAGPKPTGKALGAAPIYLAAEAKEAWAMWADELPWLTHEHRALVEIVATMRARIIAGDADLNAAFFGAYRSALSALGATPVDRSRVAAAAEDDDDDPWAFLDRPN